MSVAYEKAVAQGIVNAENDDDKIMSAGKGDPVAVVGILQNVSLSL